jgi:hypothetical protein
MKSYEAPQLVLYTGERSKYISYRMVAVFAGEKKMA